MLAICRIIRRAREGAIRQPARTQCMIPKISVVLPTYNVEAFIEEALDSLFNQPIPLFEVIVLNDGSTDATLGILQRRYAHRPELKIVTQSNQGVGAAREHGLALVTGDYVFFCDPDDYVGPDLFPAFVEQYKADPALELFYFSKRSFVDASDGRALQRRNTAASRDGWFEAGHALLEDLILSGKYHAAMWQYIFRRSVCSRFDVKLAGRAHEDHAFSMNIYLHSQATYATSTDHYFYRERLGSLTQSHKNVAYVMDSYAAYRDTLAVLKPHVSTLMKGRAVALKFMERNVSALINKCVKYSVSMPEGINRLTWRDLRDCRIRLHSRWPVLLPRAVYLSRLLRARLRALVKSRQKPPLRGANAIDNGVTG